jgi:hypothetical protein
MQCERKPIDDFCDLLASAKFFYIMPRSLAEVGRH